MRSLVGLDRAAAQAALASFMEGRTLRPNQIEFVGVIIDHLTEHGVMDAARLYESPYTDVHAGGPEGVFGNAEVERLFDILAEVRQRAVA